LMRGNDREQLATTFRPSALQMAIDLCSKAIGRAGIPGAGNGGLADGHKNSRQQATGTMWMRSVTETDSRVPPSASCSSCYHSRFSILYSVFIVWFLFRL